MYYIISNFLAVLQYIYLHVCMMYTVGQLVIESVCIFVAYFPFFNKI